MSSLFKDWTTPHYCLLVSWLFPICQLPDQYPNICICVHVREGVAMVRREKVTPRIDCIITYRLAKFEKTNAKFGRFNDLSEARYSHLHQQLRNHTKMLLDMKKDLDSVFRRIRTLKNKLAKQYETAFHAMSSSIQKLEEELGASMKKEDMASSSTSTLPDVRRELNMERQLESQEDEVINTDKQAVKLKSEDIVNHLSNHCIEENITLNHSNNHHTESGTAQALDVSIPVNSYDVVSTASHPQDRESEETDRTCTTFDKLHFDEDKPWDNRKRGNELE
ncbi:uncharacterized protein [Montipora foliosa]|uniref:uncharacterized protein isoform X2 n=1 Tax=Montipora foliosa TaxID=591990 RepID=UPI0035F10CDA